ncbi:MAG: hypothetical protein HZA50_12290 [Planctomycetes bacterium]|nr:hypothetical protein [Planctomycetota bacterium]
MLRKSDGQQGQMNAMAKQSMDMAERSAAPTAVAAASQPGSGVAQGGMMYGNKDGKNYEADKKESVSNMRQVANQAVYKRQSQTWIASNAASVDLEKDKDKIKTVQKFSDEYFEIVRLNSTDENQILATQQEGETLVIALRGQVYKFE